MLIEKGVFSEDRKRNYEKLVQNAEKARNSGSLNRTDNQFDKAEVLVTWYTFAPLLRMDEDQRRTTINEILEPILGLNVITSNLEMTFEKALLPSDEYLASISSDHPIRYIREEIERHKKNGSPLEGHTYIDLFIESDEFIIPIEAKFTSDIEIELTYSLVRNQIARTIDVTIEAAKKRKGLKKIIFLLCVPKRLHKKGRLFFYKMDDYQNTENLKNDLLHQSESIEKYFKSAHVVYWEDFASIIIKNAVQYDTLTSEEVDMLKEFYEERLILLSL